MTWGMTGIPEALESECVGNDGDPARVLWVRISLILSLVLQEEAIFAL